MISQTSSVVYCSISVISIVCTEKIGEKIIPAPPKQATNKIKINTYSFKTASGRGQEPEDALTHGFEFIWLTQVNYHFVAIKDIEILKWVTFHSFIVHLS